MTQEEVAAWVSASAAVTQALGAILAIWASFRIATRAEQRSAEAQRQAADRERSAESASVARAEAAERRAEQREEDARKAEVFREQTRIQNRRELIVSLVRVEVDAATKQADANTNNYMSNLGTIVGPAGDGNRIIAIIDKQTATMQDPDLLPGMLLVRNAAKDFEQPRTSLAAEWCTQNAALVARLREVMAKLEAAV